MRRTCVSPIAAFTAICCSRRSASGPSSTCIHTCRRSPNTCALAISRHGGQECPGPRAARAPPLRTSVRRAPARSRAGLIERQHLAFVQQRDARAALGFVEVRRRHQDGDALGQKLRQQLPELAARHRIDAGGRLVEHDHLRLVDQRAGQRELLLHAAGQLIGEPPAESRQLRHLEQAIAARVEVAHAVDLREERDVLVDAEVAVEREALRQVADRAGDVAVLLRPDPCRARGSLPLSTCSSPQIARIAVVLPAPSGPISPNISPRSTLNDTPRSASTLPYRLTTFVNSIAFMVSWSRDRCR